MVCSYCECINRSIHMKGAEMSDKTKASAGLSRRNILTGAAVAFGGGAMAAIAGCSGGDSLSETGSAQPAYLLEAWDEECDIAVIGYGGAGASAAITAAIENLGSVIVLEAAPEGAEGGNTRVSGNVVFCPDKAEDAVFYQRNLNGEYVVEDELLEAWADELVKNVNWIEENLDVVMEQTGAAEFPEIEGSECARTFTVDGAIGKPYLWDALKAQEEPLGLNIMYGTRAVRLVHDPATKEVFGVEAETTDGQTKFIKARKGVIMACGGFENDAELMRTYYEVGYPEIRFMGTPYNRGDGFKMIAPLGAKLWHTNNISGAEYCFRSGGEETNCVNWMLSGFGAKDYIYVDPQGKRFMYEEKGGLGRHGKVFEDGTWVNISTPYPTYAIFGEQCYAVPLAFIQDENKNAQNDGKLYLAKDNDGFVEAGIILKADTIEDLAEQMGYDPAVLKETIETYNANVAQGSDPEFGRGEAVYDNFAGVSQLDVAATDAAPVIEPFELLPLEPPYYATRLAVGIVNTQGGPKRSAKGEVVDYDDNPIPRLCAAGEFGSIYSYLYNGGGNVSEALSSARIAVRTLAALDSWEGGE